MWKRIQNRQKGGTGIGTPASPPTTYDEDQYRNPSVEASRHGQNVSHTRYASTGSPDLQGGERVKTLPLLPFELQAPPGPRQKRPTSEVPTVSSVYSQPTPRSQMEGFDNSHPTGRYSSQKNYSMATPDIDEVSPPSTPGGNDSGSQRVSPIEETPPRTGPEAQPWGKRHSSIPVPRRVPTTSNPASKPTTSQAETGSPGTVGTDRASVMTKWDDFTGDASARISAIRQVQRKSLGISALPEPKASVVERPSPIERSSPVDNKAIHSYKGPAEYQGLGKAPKAEGTIQTGWRGPRPVNVQVQEREEWKGASGRHAIVPPVVDRKRAPNEPAVMPSTRKFWNPNAVDDDNTPTPKPRETEMKLPPTPDIYEDGHDVRPTPPLKPSRGSPPRVLTPTGRTFLNAAEQPAVTRKPLTPPAQAPHNVSSGAIENDFHAAMKDMTLSSQPGSRFSMTTYDTGTTHDSLPGSPMVGGNTPSGSDRNLPQAVLERVRPHGGSASIYSTTKSIARKPTPSYVGPSPADGDTSGLALKSLPQSPPEAESGDLITSLEAQLDNLNYRRRNLQRIIRDLQEAALPARSNYEQRREVTRRAEGCKRELAEVMAQQHELGLRLHRAFRRKDAKEHGAEPTGLWVRRVTG